MEINTNGENKMKKEMPMSKQCCFCFPLRYGLIPWSYFKMIVAAFFILLISYTLLHTLMLLGFNGNEKFRNRVYAETGITITALTLFLTDFFLTMLFIFGGLKKNLKMLRGFYVYSVVMWVVTVLLTAMAVILLIEGWLAQYTMLRSLVINLLNFSAYFVIIIVQTYFLLTIRSEIIKSRNNGEFRFVNNMWEETCTMKGKEKVAGDETETEDD